MNKKNIILLLLLVSLPLIYWFAKKNINTNATVSKDYFAIKNLDEIDKILISKNLTKEYALLSKSENGVWKINDNWILNESRLKILFETLRDIEVKYEVDEKVAKEIATRIAANGLKTIVYSNGKAIKTFYVGEPTTDLMGTYVLAAGSKKPMVVHIPGMNGFISSRFFTDSVEWRNKNIFNVPKEKIKTITVKWAENPDDNFTIIQENGVASLMDNNLVTNKNYNALKVKAFLNLFMVYEKNNLACEGFHKKFSSAKSDSIASLNGFYTITVTQTNGKQKTLKLIRKPLQINTYEAYDEQGNLLEYERDKYWGIQNDEKLVLEIQDLVFSKIMKKRADFN